MNRLFPALFLVPCLIMAAPVEVRMAGQAAGRLVFDFTVQDTLLRGGDSVPAPAQAQPDGKGGFFYPLYFCLPAGSVITSLSVANNTLPAQAVTGGAGFIRSAWIGAIKLYPLSGKGGALRLCRQGRVSMVYKTPASKAFSAAAPDNPLAEQRLQSMIGNYDASRSWRTRSAPLAKAASLPYAGAKVKFFTGAQAIYALGYDHLASLGYDPEAIDPATFRLFSSTGEIPVSVENAEPGRFSPGDRILFYGDFERGSGVTWYPEHTYYKAYFLDWGKGLGLRAPVENGAPKYLDSAGRIKPFDPLVYSPGVRDIRPITVFRRSAHLEQDNIILRLSSPDQLRSDEDLAPEDYEFALEDYWMWSRMDLATNAQEFTLDGRPAPTGAAAIRINFTGYTKGAHRISIDLNGQPLETETDSNWLSWTGQAPAVFASGNLAVHQGYLREGLNRIYVKFPSTQRDIIFLNWIEMDYDALPGIVSGPQMVTLDTGDVHGTGCYKLAFTGLSASSEIWDIQGRRFTGLYGNGNGVDLYDILDKPVTYCASTAVAAPFRFSRKSDADLTAAGLGCDLLIIVPDSLRDAVAAYAAFRTAQGLSVLVAPVEAIYDRFGDGSVDPEAIKAFVRYAYEHYAPSPFYLLLIGDTSEGSDKLEPFRNLIPTCFVQVNGWGIASADSRFTTVSGDDLFPDLSVGRIPGRNRAEINTALAKIMDYERASEPGPWKNDFLLLGGAEGGFTAANRRFRDFILSDRFNVRRVDTDTASEYFWPDNRTPAEAQRIINSGAGFVSFYGHGGGSVWSDGKPDLMGHDAARALTNYRSLPVVYSLTCLTASFEAASFTLPADQWPPLGETMLLSGRGGASAFYGASGHSFLSSDYFLGLFLMRASTDPSFTRIGDIIFNAEQQLISSYGAPYFTVAGQYNLLGDPAMAVNQPAPMEVTLKNPVLSPGDTLTVLIKTRALSSGYGVVRLFESRGDLRFWHSFELSGQRDTIRVPFKAGLRFPEGVARVIVWNGAQDEMGQAPFTISEISFSRVATFTTDSARGDTLYTDQVGLGERAGVEAEVFVPPGVSLTALYAAWKPDTSYATNEIFPNPIRMSLARAGDSARPALFRSDTGIPVIGENHAELKGMAYSLTAQFLRFGADTVAGQYTRFYHFDVLPPPDLSFPASNKISVLVLGSPVARSRFLNYGRAAVRHSFSIRQAVNDTGLSPSLVHLDTLASAGRDSADIPLRASGFFKVRVDLDAADQVAESNEGNNSAAAFFGLTGGEMGRLDSVLSAPYGGLAVRPARPTDTFNLVLLMDDIDSLDGRGLPVFRAKNAFAPAPLQAPFRPRGAPALTRYDLTLLSDNASGDSAVRVFYQYDSLPAIDSSQEAADILGFYTWDPSLNFWSWTRGRVDATDSTVSMVTGLGKRIMPGRRSDFKGPEVFAFVNGRVLAYQDYIPLNSPIQVTVRDESAVDTNRVRVMLSGRELLARDRYALGYIGSSGEVSISFKPFREGADSLCVVAWDVNGNVSDTVGFGYQLGSELMVKSFANHPNPFGARTTFALTITDDADVEIRIFTLAGRMIRRFTLTGVVGYQEIPWDAADEEGRKLSNGVYYLKLKVRNRDRTIEQIHKIAKAEGR